MNIREVVSPVTRFKTQLLLQMNKSGAVFPDCYRTEHAPGATLIEPINGDPYVVTFDGDTATATEFKPDNQSSGTDKLRARILAKRFFEGVTQ